MLGIDPEAIGTDIVLWFVRRWSVEVTFEAARAHLGVETPRQWSKRAIARTTPILLGLFSQVTLMADRLVAGQAMPVRTKAWYRKTQPTFSDALALVRCHFWRAQDFSTSRSQTDHTLQMKWTVLFDKADERFDAHLERLKQSNGER